MRSGILRNIAIRIVGGFIIMDGSTFETIAMDSEAMESHQELSIFEKCIDNPLDRVRDALDAAIESRFESQSVENTTDSGLLNKEKQNLVLGDQEGSSSEEGSVNGNSAEEASEEDVDTKKEVGFDVNEVFQNFTLEDLQEKYDNAQCYIENLESESQARATKIISLESQLKSSKSEINFQKTIVQHVAQKMKCQQYTLIVLFIAHIIRFFW